MKNSLVSVFFLLSLTGQACFAEDDIEERRAWARDYAVQGFMSDYRIQYLDAELKLALSNTLMTSPDVNRALIEIVTNTDLPDPFRQVATGLFVADPDPSIARDLLAELLRLIEPGTPNMEGLREPLIHQIGKLLGFPAPSNDEELGAQKKTAEVVFNYTLNLEDPVQFAELLKAISSSSISAEVFYPFLHRVLAESNSAEKKVAAAKTLHRTSGTPTLLFENVGKFLELVDETDVKVELVRALRYLVPPGAHWNFRDLMPEKDFEEKFQHMNPGFSFSEVYIFLKKIYLEAEDDKIKNAAYLTQLELRGWFDPN
ncbi:MAG: hypothetical protein AAF202_11020, partial [Pseudomonadota bacterium]